MTLRPAIAAALLFLALPALAQTDPATQPPAAGSAPKPYVPPAATDETDTPPMAPPITNVPPADPTMQGAAEGLPTQIEDVQVVGPWTEGGTNGVWRTVMMQVGGAEKEVYRFFVQKLDRVGPGARILDTTEIKEVAGVDGAVVGYRADEPQEDGEGTDGGAPVSDLTLFFDVVPSNGEIPETYELHFMKDRTYNFGPASN